MLLTGALLLLLQSTTDHAAGLSEYRQRNYAKAAETLEHAVRAERAGSPEYKESTLLLGQSYYLLNQFDKAIPWLEQAATEPAAPAEISYMLGNAYLLSGNAAKAQIAFAQLFGKQPYSAAAALILAQMMVRNELWDAADSVLKKALAADPRIPEAHYLLGIVAVSRGDLDRSAAEFEQETALNPNFAMAYYRLGDAYGRREEWDRAIVQLQRSIWLNPNYSGPYILLGKAYLRKDDLVNAEGTLRTALRLDPQNASAQYLLGQTLVRAGRTEEGRKILEKSRQQRREQ